MKKVVLASLISVIIIILTLTIMPFALNADIEWKSSSESYVIPGAGVTRNWSNPNGENINFVLVRYYYIPDPTLLDRSNLFTQDGTWFAVTVNGIDTPNISVTWISGSEDNHQAEVEYRWGQSIRTSELVCQRVWINEDNNFQFSFWYPYADNNWVRIYDMSGNMVYEADMPYDNPNLIVALPDGMYTVKTYHDQPDPIQTFVIGKP